MNTEHPPVLPYRTPSRRFRTPPPPDDEEQQRWRFLRRLYWIVLVAIVASLAMTAGKNLIMFGKLTKMSPEDFVDIVQKQDVATVVAIKRYRADTGALPEDIDSLVPRYLKVIPGGQEMNRGQFFQFPPSISATSDEIIIYDFTPGMEGWSVKGPFANGKISLPPVP